MKEGDGGERKRETERREDEAEETEWGEEGREGKLDLKMPKLTERK